MILAGDIGGTSTRLALFDGGLGEPRALEVYGSREHHGLEEMVREFLAVHPAEVERAALDGSDATAAQALDLMISIYGAQAGNVALTLMATGGVYLGGGIPPKILPRLADGRFMRAFVGKGRFASMLERIPVRVILNERAALLGAARFAAERL